MAISTWERITKTPGVCGGKACISGRRIRVLDVVVWHEHMGMSADEIVSQFPTLSLSEVHLALAYYFDHVEEIQDEMRAERVAAEEFGLANPSQVASKLRQKPLDQAS